MQTYSQHQPTAFDRRGAFLDDDRQGWYVLPVTRTRDSGVLEESNFLSVLRILGGESETCEVHRFGHWGPGWYEIIIVSPERLEEAEEIEASLADCPVMDDADYSEREWQAACDCWANMRLRERIKVCERFRVSIFAARRDEMPADLPGDLLQYLAGD